MVLEDLNFARSGQDAYTIGRHLESTLTTMIDEFPAEYQKQIRDSIARETVAPRPPVDQGKPRWISISERLPEAGEWVLVYFPEIDGDLDLKVSPAFYENGHWESEIDRIDNLITHWMPLPEAPHD